jgi:hypothetical protein
MQALVKLTPKFTAVLSRGTSGKTVQATQWLMQHVFVMPALPN